MSASVQDDTAKTAFVFAGGGSFGAIQVGMLHSLVANGVSADMVVGSSVGAINGAYFAGTPTLKGVLELETIWRGLTQRRISRRGLFRAGGLTGGAAGAASLLGAAGLSGFLAACGVV